MPLHMGKRKRGVKVNGLIPGAFGNRTGLVGIPNKGGCARNPYGDGETGGKAWFGGLACSGLAGYQAR